MDGDTASSELERLTQAAEALLGEPVIAAGYFRPMNLRMRSVSTWMVEIGRWFRLVAARERRVRHLPAITFVAVTSTSVVVLDPDTRGVHHPTTLLGPFSIPAPELVAAGPDQASLRLTDADGCTVELQGLVPIDAATSTVHAALTPGR